MDIVVIVFPKQGIHILSFFVIISENGVEMTMTCILWFVACTERSWCLCQSQWRQSMRQGFYICMNQRTSIPSENPISYTTSFVFVEKKYNVIASAPAAFLWLSSPCTNSSMQFESKNSVNNTILMKATPTNEIYFPLETISTTKLKLEFNIRLRCRNHSGMSFWCVSGVGI